MKIKFLLLLFSINLTSYLLKAQTLDPNFEMPTPYAPAEIIDIVSQEDGKIILAGDINFYNDTPVGEIVRINLDGSLDETFSFDPSYDFNFRKIGLLSTGEIIAISFKAIVKISGTGVIEHQLTLDELNTVSMVIQPDDKIIFASSSEGLKRYNSDLTLDESFNNRNEINNGYIHDVALQNDNIIISGSFSNINGVLKNDIARFDSNGNLDDTFDVGEGADGRVTNVTVQKDGKILVSPSNGWFNGIKGLVRLNIDGSIDSGFNYESLPWSEILLQEEKILLRASNARDDRLVRLNSDGSIDESFSQIYVENHYLECPIEIDDDNNIITANNSDLIYNEFGINSFDPNGVFNSDFNSPLTKYGSYKIADYYGDQLLVSGNFMKVGDFKTFNVVKLNADGSVNEDFNIPKELTYKFSSQGHPIEIKHKSANEIYISYSSHLLKVDETGEPDDSFETKGITDNYGFAGRFELLDDGKIVTSTSNKVYMINSDGTENTDFTFEYTGLLRTGPYDIDLQSDGKIVYGGAFEEINHHQVNKIARFDEGGNIDVSFYNGSGISGNFIEKVKVNKNDDILIWGFITDINGYSSDLWLYKLDKDGNLDVDFIENLNNTKKFSSGVSYISNFKDNTFLISDNTNLYLIDSNGIFFDDFSIPENININSDKNLLHPFWVTESSFLLLGQFQINGQSDPQFGLLFNHNFKPEILDFSKDISIDEEDEVEIQIEDFSVVDRDNIFPDDFTLNIQQGENYSIDGNQIIPSPDFNGELTVPVKVNDGSDNSNAYDIIITVNPVNDAPVITGLTDELSSSEDSSFKLNLSDLTVTDPDNTFPEDFSLTITGGENYILEDNQIIPALNFNGKLNVPVSVNDGVTESQIFEVVVQIEPVNDPPVISFAKEGMETYESQPFEIQLEDLTVVDPDNVYPDDFTLIIQEGNNYSVDGNLIIPNEGFIGELLVSIKVSDGKDESSLFEIPVRVEVITSILDETHSSVIFPNPSSGELTLQIENSFAGILTIEIVNMDGKIVLCDKFNKEKNLLLKTINLNELTNGIYLIKILQEDRALDIQRLSIIK